MLPIIGVRCQRRRRRKNGGLIEQEISAMFPNQNRYEGI
jgi:hypothetical protein